MPQRAPFGHRVDANHAPAEDAERLRSQIPHHAQAEDHDPGMQAEIGHHDRGRGHPGHA